MPATTECDDLDDSRGNQNSIESVPRRDNPSIAWQDEQRLNGFGFVLDLRGDSWKHVAYLYALDGIRLLNAPR